jgi:hypothetical protein
MFYTYVKGFFKNISLWDYFLGFLPVGASGLALGGLPLPGTTFIASKSSSVYKASCEKGLRPALRRRLLTVSFGRLSLSAISEIVIPFIPHIIGILRKKLKNVHLGEYLLYICIVKLRKELKMFIKRIFFSLQNIRLYGQYRYGMSNHPCRPACLFSQDGIRAALKSPRKGPSHFPAVLATDGGGKGVMARTPPFYLEV